MGPNLSAYGEEEGGGGSPFYVSTPSIKACDPLAYSLLCSYGPTFVFNVLV